MELDLQRTQTASFLHQYSKQKPMIQLKSTPASYPEFYEEDPNPIRGEYYERPTTATIVLMF